MTVRRNTLTDVEWVASPIAARLDEGDVVVAIDSFGLTANNITYASFGDAARYWDFFPVGNGRGIIPVSGYATVVVSASDDIAVGEQLFGFLPMATHLVIRPANVGARGLVDASAHRVALPPTYNEYLRVESNIAHRSEQRPLQMLLKPLYMLSWLVFDMLTESAAFGADQVIITSASSRTALGLARLLTTHPIKGVHTIGLTSRRNLAFVDNQRCSDEVLGYENWESLDPSRATCIIDIGGGTDILTRLHRHFAERVVASWQIGDTHQQGAAPRTLPDPQPTLFFAPDRVRQRRRDWGASEFQRRHALAWDELAAWTADWLEIRHEYGSAAVEQTYRDVLAGRISPATATILSWRSPANEPL